MKFRKSADGKEAHVSFSYSEDSITNLQLAWLLQEALDHKVRTTYGENGYVMSVKPIAETPKERAKRRDRLDKVLQMCINSKNGISHLAGPPGGSEREAYNRGRLDAYQKVIDHIKSGEGEAPTAP